ncbi:hypothetical protein DKX38_028528 [Salix brachista]|uniref:PGG domain-containing protein n=1 Tax=Salix brachista TaxID=2182728 RepID=A0A5N5J6V8_9ROSI|nr:hypothetical protein DKX38_028528 [Salix brachista]
MAAVEITNGVESNATIDSPRRGTNHNNIEIVVHPQLRPAGDGAMEITDGVNINATIGSPRRGTNHNNIEIVVHPQLRPAGDGAMEITDGVNINATIDSARRGTPHNEIELVVVPQQLPTVDGEERKRHLQLYQAALSGDWDTAEEIYKLFPGDVNAKITKRGETALHIAAATEHTHFVKQLVGKMTTEDLYVTNNAGNTAFCVAAISGVEAIAKVMMETGSDLAMARGRENLLPIYMATLLGHRGMVSYLYKKTYKQLTDGDRIALLVALIKSDMYDIAWKMITEHPGLAYARDEHQLTALHVFAQKSCMPSIAVDQSLPGFWNKNLNPFSVFKLARMKKLMHKQALDLIQYLWEQVVLLDDAKISRQIGKPWPLIFTAAERGNLDFLTILIRLYPELIFKVDQNTYSIFHIAILNRHEDIFRIIYQIGSIKNLITTYKDKEGNNMLHLAAKLLESPSRLNVIPGAALQLQRELLWSIRALARREKPGVLVDGLEKRREN